MVASRVSKKQGEMSEAVYISEQKHSELVECCINWYEKTCAIIIDLSRYFCCGFFLGFFVVFDSISDSRCSCYSEIDKA